MKINGMRVLIVHTDLEQNDSAANMEVLRQADEISAALTALEAKPSVASYKDAARKAKDSKPDLIFNLVEAVNGTDRDLYKAALAFNNSYYPYTGSNHKCLQALSDKVAMKRVMAEHDILTPMWHKFSEPDSFFHKGEYIIKPLFEHGSHMISGSNIVKLLDAEDADEKIAKMFPVKTGEFFAERFIDGREFNVSVLEVDGEPVVLPLAEIVFEGYGSKPKIVCEKAKWDESSEEYHKTVRTFDTVEKHSRLEGKIIKICTECWNIFKMSGYGRVDIRVDKIGEPYVLEINANPSLASDAGFFAACSRDGYDYKKMVELILKSAMRHK